MHLEGRPRLYPDLPIDRAPRPHGQVDEVGATWHVTVATASHNALLSAFMHASRQAQMTGSSATRFHEHAAREQTWEAHLAITEAIADQDAARAYELMGGHVWAGEESVTHLLG